MANPDFERLQTPDATTNRIQDNSQKSTQKVTAAGSNVNRGQSIENITLAAGVAIEIPHRMGRIFNGASVVRTSSGAQLTIEESQVDRKKFFRVTAAVATTASFLVF